MLEVNRLRGFDSHPLRLLLVLYLIVFCPMEPRIVDFLIGHRVRLLMVPPYQSRAFLSNHEPKLLGQWVSLSESIYILMYIAELYDIDKLFSLCYYHGAVHRGGAKRSGARLQNEFQQVRLLSPLLITYPNAECSGIFISHCNGPL